MGSSAEPITESDPLGQSGTPSDFGSGAIWRGLGLVTLAALGATFAATVLGANWGMTVVLAVAALRLLVPVELQASLSALRREIARRTTASGRTLLLGGVLWGIAAFGVALRLRAFMAERALWLDEASLARSFIDRDMVELITTPLASGQSAPPGYLALVRFFVGALGFSESSLRAAGFLASVATVAIAVLLARRTFRTWLFAAVFVGMVSLSPILVYYSQEFKPYSFDALAAVIILLIRSRPNGWSASDGLLLALVSVVSLPGAALVGVLIGLDVLAIRTRAQIRARLPLWLLGGAGIAVHLSYVLLAGTNREGMISYWQGHSFPPDAGLFAQLRWHFDKAVELAWVGLAHGNIGYTRVAVGETWLVIGFLVVAVFGLLRRSPAIVFAAAALIVAALLAQMSIYPLGTRLSLHLVPIFVLLFATGAEEIAALRGSYKAPMLIVALLVLALPTSVAWAQFKQPVDGMDIRLAVEILNERASPGDTIIMNRFSRRSFEVYEDSRITQPAFSVDWTSDSRGSVESVAEILAAGASLDSPRPGRVWVVASHRTTELRDAARGAMEIAAYEAVCEELSQGLLVALYMEKPAQIDAGPCAR